MATHTTKAIHARAALTVVQDAVYTTATTLTAVVLVATALRRAIAVAVAHRHRRHLHSTALIAQVVVRTDVNKRQQNKQ